MSAQPIMSETEMLDEARRRVATGRGVACSNAIINGQWDSGKLVQDALEQVKAEQPLH